MKNKIHKTAIIEEGAVIGSGNVIGPYCVIGSNTKLGNNNVLKSHVIIDAIAEIGDNNTFFPFSSINLPQDKKYHGEKSRIIIGNDNIFREYSTVNAGTESGGMITKVGSGGLFMMSSHVAHDCVIGDNVVLANNVALAGHVHVGDFAILGGQSAVHQHTRVGEYAMIGGMSAISEDIIPFGMAVGERSNLAGLNVVGMKRRGFSREEIHEVRRAYDMIFIEKSNLTFMERIENAKAEFADSTNIRRMIEFIVSDGTRAVCKPKVLSD
jgi:UDP-N-acetylglucosamine acyltransferase